MFKSVGEMGKESRSMKKQQHTLHPDLPQELIREILLRLPARSVSRFKCVCKPWLSLISDPQFGISHYDLAVAPSHRLLLRSKSTDFYAVSIDADAPFIEGALNVYHLLVPPPSPPGRSHFHPLHHGRNQAEILGSCRGLILLYYPESHDLILWNPTIGVHRRLPKSNFEYHDINHDFLLYGFGYDPSTDDYLIIVIALDASEYDETGIHIFSFKTNSWTRLDIDIPYENLDDTFKAGSLINGALYWLVFPDDEEVPVIIAFDLMQRSLSEIPLSNHLIMEPYQVYSLTVMGGRLGVCCSVQGHASTQIWVMEEKQPSWTIPCYHFFPICITKDGGIFGSNMRILEKYNHEGTQQKSLGVEQELSYCTNLQSAMYRESLLPLPSVIRETSEDDHGETSKDDRGKTSQDDQQ
ncbi:F-box/kelch-repeat protein [Spatholobus suberectus]|nr:F-box/kelch-repeat protein [Spatholobus suberectus]